MKTVQDYFNYIAGISDKCKIVINCCYNRKRSFLMRVIVNPDVLRQFDLCALDSSMLLLEIVLMSTRHTTRKTATAFGLLQTVVDAAAPLDAAKLLDIINELTVDRFNLAKEFLSQAQAQDLSTISGQKIAISRSYYAMYHSARTVIFHYERADVEKHEEIAKQLPSTLPNRAHWGFRLNVCALCSSILN